MQEESDARFKESQRQRRKLRRQGGYGVYTSDSGTDVERDRSRSRTRSRNEPESVPKSNPTSRSTPPSEGAQEVLRRLAAQKRAADTSGKTGVSGGSKQAQAPPSKTGEKESSATTNNPSSGSKTLKTPITGKSLDEFLEWVIRANEEELQKQKASTSTKSSTDPKSSAKTKSSTGTKSSKADADHQFAKPSGTAPKQRKVETANPKAKAPRPKSPEPTDSDTDYYELRKQHNYKRIVMMCNQERNESSDQEFMAEAWNTSHRVGRKQKAFSRAYNKGIQALNEVVLQEEKSDDATMAEAMNFAIHFMTPCDCILFLDVARVKSKPLKSKSTSTKIEKLINCVRKRMEFIVERYEEDEHEPKEDIEEEIICKWKVGTIDIKNCAKLLREMQVERSIDTADDTEDQEEVQVEMEVEEAGPSETQNLSRKKPVSKRVEFVPESGGTKDPQPSKTAKSSRSQRFLDSQKVQTKPSILKKKKPAKGSVRRSPSPMEDESLEGSETSGYKERSQFDPNRMDDVIAPPEHTSCNDQEVSDAMKRDKDKELWKLSTIALDGDRKLQGQLFVKWWKTYQPGSGDIPDGLIQPPTDCFDLLGETPDEENDPKFTKTLAERYKEAYYQYVALKQCANRMVNHCKNLETIFQPDYLPFVKGLRLSLMSHFERLKHFTAFRMRSQMGDFLFIIDSLERCQLKLEKSQFSQVETKDPRDRNTVEVVFKWPNQDGSKTTELLRMPKGWNDEPLNEKDPIVVRYLKHDAVQPIGGYDGKESSEFITWWYEFKDAIHRVPGMTNRRKYQELSEKILTGKALQVFLGGRTKGACKRDREYVKGIHRLCNHFNRTDNMWEKMNIKLEKFRVTETKAEEIQQKLYEFECLKEDLIDAKPASKTDNDVARMIHYKIGDIFSGSLLAKIRTHVSMNLAQDLKAGHYNQMVNRYIAELHRDVGSSVYQAECEAESEDKKAMRILKEAIRNKEGKLPTKEKNVLDELEESKSKESSSAPAKPKPRPFIPYKKFEPGRKAPAHCMDMGFSQDEEAEYSEENYGQQEAGGISEEIFTIKQQLAAMAEATHSVLQMPLLFQSAQAYLKIPQPTQGSMNVTQQTMAVEPHPAKTQVTDPNAVKKIIEQTKQEQCIFKHRNPNAGATHTIWECAVNAAQKNEELGKMNRCRVCWQTGHTGTECTVRPNVLCDHCKAVGHWQPFCGAYISSKITTLKSARTPAEGNQQTSAISEKEESYEKYVKRMESQAAHASRLLAAQAMQATQFVLKDRTPLSPVGKSLTPKAETQ